MTTNQTNGTGPKSGDMDRKLIDDYAAYVQEIATGNHNVLKEGITTIMAPLDFEEWKQIPPQIDGHIFGNAINNEELTAQPGGVIECLKCNYCGHVVHADNLTAMKCHVGNMHPERFDKPAGFKQWERVDINEFGKPAKKERRKELTQDIKDGVF